MKPMKPKKLVKKHKRHIQATDPWKAEVINRSVLVGSGFIAVFANHFIANKMITRPLDLIALIGATYGFVQLSRGNSFKHMLGVLSVALLIMLGIFIIVVVICFMILIS